VVGRNGTSGGIGSWYLLVDDRDYDDLGVDYFTRRNPDRQRDRVIAQLQNLGSRVSLDRIALEPCRGPSSQHAVDECAGDMTLGTGGALHAAPLLLEIGNYECRSGKCGSTARRCTAVSWPG
jgi:hypothetical protein